MKPYEIEYQRKNGEGAERFETARGPAAERRETARAPGRRARASDAERERTVSALGAAAGEGRLTLEEADERIAAALGARFGDELDALTADLPDDRASARRRRPWRPPFGLVPVVLAVVVLLATVGAAAHGHFLFPAVPIVFLLLRFVVFARPRRWA
jgi:hypothetical protein